MDAGGAVIIANRCPAGQMAIVVPRTAALAHNWAGCRLERLAAIRGLAFRGLALGILAGAARAAHYGL